MRPVRSRAGFVVAIATLAACRLAGAAPLAIHIHGDNAMFQVLVSPGTVGTDNFVLQLMTGDGSPLLAREATLILSLPGSGIEPLERKAMREADGYWHLRDVPLPHPGRWHMRVDAVMAGSRKISLEEEFDVPARQGDPGGY